MNRTGKILTLIGLVTGIIYITRKRGDSSLSKIRNTSDGDANSGAKQNLNNIKGQKTKPSSETMNSSNGEDKASTEDTEDSRTQRMYKDLGMTESQRKRYIADYRAVVDDWKTKNPGRDMDDTIKEEQLSATLNAVLNEAQYAMYRDWSSSQRS